MTPPTLASRTTPTRPTYGDGNACITPIVKRLRSTAAFSTAKTNGTLSCSVRYDSRR
jgi:hypothetical protein